MLRDIIDKRVKEIQLKKTEKKDRTWKYNSNKDQFHFNEGILTELEQVKTNKKLERRNKHIKMADRSKTGWKIVNEYLTNPVASDAEDDRLIKKCEKAALAKIAEEKEKKKKPTNKKSSERSTESPTRRDRFRNAPRRPRYSRNITCFRCGRVKHYAEDCYSYDRRGEERERRR